MDRRALALLTAALLLDGCRAPSDSAARFCFRNARDGFLERMLRPAYIDIDLADRRLYASDTSEPIDLVDETRHFGMIAPIALLVPRLGSRPAGERVTRIRQQDLLLVFRPGESRAGDFVGEVFRAMPGNETSHVLTYRYNARYGVSDIVINHSFENTSYQEVLRWCGGARLFAQEA